MSDEFGLQCYIIFLTYTIIKSIIFQIKNSKFPKKIHNYQYIKFLILKIDKKVFQKIFL
ncbi:MAG: hypothetical protein H6Q20_1278 [Bacteroidetes bacterium]|jgi:hypothetical protein|nr:hypothetical protein [Bacteroidota bacterium]